MWLGSYSLCFFSSISHFQLKLTNSSSYSTTVAQKPFIHSVLKSRWWMCICQTHTGAVLKCVMTDWYQETVKEQEDWTLNFLVILNATGFGPISCFLLTWYKHSMQYRQSCACWMHAGIFDILGFFFVFKRQSGLEAQDNKTRLKSLLSKDALRFALKAGEFFFLLSTSCDQLCHVCSWSF